MRSTDTQFVELNILDCVNLLSRGNCSSNWAWHAIRAKILNRRFEYVIDTLTTSMWDNGVFFAEVGYPFS